MERLSFLVWPCTHSCVCVNLFVFFTLAGSGFTQLQHSRIPTRFFSSPTTSCVTTTSRCSLRPCSRRGESVTKSGTRCIGLSPEFLQTPQEMIQEGSESKRSCSYALLWPTPTGCSTVRMKCAGISLWRRWREGPLVPLVMFGLQLGRRACRV
jgi:hypothetical protein